MITIFWGKLWKTLYFWRLEVGKSENYIFVLDCLKKKRIMMTNCLSFTWWFLPLWLQRKKFKIVIVQTLLTVGSVHKYMVWNEVKMEMKLIKDFLKYKDNDK